MTPAVTPARVLLILALVALPLLALSGGIDGLAENNLDGAMGTTGAIYATARGINAVVSLLQGTELDLPFVTLSVGEVLDPVNDLIERFATLVLFALGAIAAQKVLLLVVASHGFNYLLAGIAALTIAAMLARRNAAFGPLLKLFVIAVFVRFALGIVVIANHWVDAAFLQEPDAQRQQAMQQFETELKEVRNLATRDPTRAYTDSRARVDEIESTLRAGQRELQAKTREIEALEARINKELADEDSLCKLSIRTRMVSPTCPDSIVPEVDALKAKEREQANIEDRLTVLQQRLEDAQAELECLRLRAQGKACTLWDHIPEAPDIAALRGKIDGLEAQLTAFTQNAWLLVASLLLKSILIPLLFLYGLVKLTGAIWRSDIGRLGID